VQIASMERADSYDRISCVQPRGTIGGALSWSLLSESWPSLALLLAATWLAKDCTFFLPLLCETEDAIVGQTESLRARGALF
jgi:hypothetical protein